MIGGRLKIKVMSLSKTLPVAVIVLSAASCAHATSYATPKRHDVFSPNRLFVLDVNPETSVHAVYSTADRSTPLWTFSKRVWHYPFFVSNDGKVVATTAWKHVREDKLATVPCINLWNASGTLRSYGFSEICPSPPPTSWVGVGPIGDSWRTWYTDASQDGDTFTVTTTDWYSFTFSLRDGAIVSKRLSLSGLYYS